MQPSAAVWRQLCDAALESIKHLRDDGPRLTAMAPDLSGEYAPNVRARPGSRGGTAEPDSAVFNRATTPTRDLKGEIDVWVDATIPALQRVISLASLGRGRLLGSAIEVAAVLQTASVCVNCSELPHERLRAGRCEACYQYRRRHAGVDRPLEQADTTSWDRARHLGAAQYEAQFDEAS